MPKIGIVVAVPARPRNSGWTSHVEPVRYDMFWKMLSPLFAPLTVTDALSGANALADAKSSTPTLPLSGGLRPRWMITRSSVDAGRPARYASRSCDPDCTPLSVNAAVMATVLAPPSETYGICPAPTPATLPFTVLPPTVAQKGAVASPVSWVFVMYCTVVATLPELSLRT